MQPVCRLSPGALFFFEHAGFSYPAGMQSEAADWRTANAVGLNACEQLLRIARCELEVEVVWELDHDAMYDDRRSGGDDIATQYIASLRMDGRTLAVLGGIDAPEGHDHRRVVEAELTREAQDELDEALRAKGERCTCGCARR